MSQKKEAEEEEKKKIQVRPGAAGIVYRAQDLTSVHSSLRSLDDAFKVSKAVLFTPATKRTRIKSGLNCMCEWGYCVNLCTFQR